MQISKWTAEGLFNLFLVVEKKFVLVTFNHMNIIGKLSKVIFFQWAEQVDIASSKTIFSLLLRSSGVSVFVDCFAGGSNSPHEKIN